MSNETLTVRLKELAKSLDLSQSQFADKLEVQRSTMSHLFSGRNKPSISLIVKISEAFPEMSMPWLLHGKGKMLVSNSSKEALKPDDVTDVNNDGNSATLSQLPKDPQSEKEIKAIPGLGSQGSAAVQLTKIVMIYSDGSCKIVDA